MNPGKLYYNRIDYGNNNIWYRDNRNSLNNDKERVNRKT